MGTGKKEEVLKVKVALCVSNVASLIVNKPHSPVVYKTVY
jgi:hypothetical protein